MVVQTATMPGEQAAALLRILTVTRQAWQMTEAQPEAAASRDGSTARRRAAQSRTAYLTELASRALQAQVMALRCRQAFVG
ncbi:hypothetical protein [Cupriavidus sp. AU9028]|uniref:hypothetical protein n=1 Tax=Cupriavidus sp. AU9028 TaxID=2871157 RepID=UPI001C9803F7|nr:hypothetical protein [Cupriavidus sp. AU9028]MBY4897784.1 hypothetical protein [Cupriavidus sp. AU9028]